MTSIRTQLFVLALCAVVPVLGFAAYVSWLLVEQDREAIRSGVTARARAILTAADADLGGAITTLQALATSRALDNGDLMAFHAEAVRVLASQSDWSNVSLALPSGEQVVNALEPPGRPLRGTLDAVSAERVVSTLRPAVGSVVIGRTLKVPLLPVRVPVMRNGTLSYVLSAAVLPDSFEALLVNQQLPAGWVIAIVDASDRIVARNPPLPAGSLPSESFRAALRSAPEGWFRDVTREGVDTFTAHVRSDFSGWVIGLAVPADYFEAGARRTVKIVALGALASIMLALFVAALLGRRIATPLVQLASSARALGRGEAANPPLASSLTEVTEVANALKDAGAAVRMQRELVEREKDALQAADQAKDQFIALLSHELRNPLAALSAASHVLELADPSKEASTHARGVIKRQTVHMTRLIEDLLDVNRVVMGKATLVRDRLDLAELVSETIRSWRASHRLAQHVVTVDARPVWLEGDRSRLEQVFANLLDNAVKFTPRGNAIRVEVFAEAGEAVLRVQDEGDGLPPEALNRMFDLFVQGPQGIDRSAGGLGVGLALVKGLVELHGGNVKATSDGPGRGTTFTVRLPAVAASARPREAQAPALLKPSARARRILVVEDNTDAREMLRATLEMSGHKVRAVGDSRAAMTQAGTDTPEVMILDLGLPDLNGFELAQRIRAAPWGRDVFLLALTGYGMPEDRRRALEAGFDAYAIKPILPEQLEQLVEGAAR